MHARTHIRTHIRAYTHTHTHAYVPQNFLKRQPPSIDRGIQTRLRQVLHDLPRAVTVSFEMPDLEALYEMAEDNGTSTASHILPPWPALGALCHAHPALLSVSQRITC